MGKSTKVSRCLLGWAATSSPASLVAMMGYVVRATAGRREGDAGERKRAPQGLRRCREEMSRRFGWFGKACRPRARNLPMGSGEKRRCDARTTEWDCGAKRLQRDPAPRLEIDRIKDAGDDAGVDTVLSPMYGNERREMVISGVATAPDGRQEEKRVE